MESFVATCRIGDDALRGRGAGRYEPAPQCLRKVNTLTLSEKTNIVFSIVASLAFCLLVGCGGGGGGSTTSSLTPEPIATPDLIAAPDPIAAPEPDDPDDPDDPDEPDNDESVFNPFPAKHLHDAYSENLPLWKDGKELLNKIKFDMINAQSAWESGYTGDGVVIGIMEGVDQFHELFKNKIHPASVLTSLYPDDIPPPPEKYITDEFTKHPEFACHLQFENVNHCPDTSGNQKYFWRDENDDIHVLPGLMNFRKQCTDEQRNDMNLFRPNCEHDIAYDTENPLCPVFTREEEGEEVEKIILQPSVQ